MSDGGDICPDCRLDCNNPEGSQAAIAELALLSTDIKENDVRNEIRSEMPLGKSCGDGLSISDLAQLSEQTKIKAAEKAEKAGKAAEKAEKTEKVGKAEKDGNSGQSASQAVEKERESFNAPVVITSDDGEILNESVTTEPGTASAAVKKVKKEALGVSAAEKKSGVSPLDNERIRKVENITSAYEAALKTESSVLKTEPSVLKTELSVLKAEPSVLKTEPSVLKTEPSVIKVISGISGTEKMPAARQNKISVTEAFFSAPVMDSGYSDRPNQTDSSEDSGKPRKTDGPKKDVKARRTDEPKRTYSPKDLEKPEKTDGLKEFVEAGEIDEPKDTDESRDTDEPKDTDNPDINLTTDATEEISAEKQLLYSGEWEHFKTGEDSDFPEEKFFGANDSEITRTDAGMSRDELAAAVLAVLNNSKESGSDVQSVLNNNISVNAKAENTVSHSGTLLKGITRIKKVSARAGRLLRLFLKKTALYLSGKPIGKNMFKQSDLEKNPIFLCIAYFPLMFPVPAILNPRSHYSRYISLCGAVLTVADLAVLLFCRFLCNILRTVFTNTVNMGTSFEHMALSYTGYRLISLTETIGLFLIFIMFVYSAAMTIFGRMPNFASERLYRLSFPQNNKENASGANGSADNSADNSISVSRRGIGISDGESFSDCGGRKNFGVRNNCAASENISERKNAGASTGDDSAPIKVISSSIAEREAAKVGRAADSDENAMVKITGEPLENSNTVNSGQNTSNISQNISDVNLNTAAANQSVAAANPDTVRENKKAGV